MDENPDLMARAAEGDWNALAKLLGQGEGPLFAFFYRLGCHPNSIEDLVQDVMIRLYQARERYDPARPFSSWLYGIAKHVWQDYLRRLGREPRRLAAMGLAEEVPSMAADSLEQSLEAEQAERVRWALERLPEEQRMTLILRHYQGLSYQEIAEALGIPVGTVKWRIHEALHKVKEFLAARGRGRSRA